MKKKRTAEAANTQLRKSKANTEGMAAATQGIQEKLEKDTAKKEAKAEAKADAALKKKMVRSTLE